MIKAAVKIHRAKILKSIGWCFFCVILYEYSPFLWRALEPQKGVFLILILIGLIALIKPIQQESVQKGLGVIVWLSLALAFVLSLEPWIEEGCNLYDLYSYFLRKGYGSQEAFGILMKKIVQKEAHLWEVWGTWGLISLSLLIALLGSLSHLLIAPFRSEDRRSTKGSWNAQFMKRSEVEKLIGTTSGLPLGRVGGRLLKYKANPEKGWLGGHHAVFAGSRAGKGVSFVIPAILDHEGSVVCLDIKGENFAVTKKYRESLGRRVVVLNPYSVIEESFDSFNPLDFIRKESLSRDLHVIADGMVKPEVGMNAHFTDLVRDLLSATIEVKLKQKKKPTLYECASFFSSPAFVEDLEKWAKAPHSYGLAPSKIATAFLAAGDKEQGSILTTLQRNTNWITPLEMKKCLSKSTFDLEDILEDKLDLFIVAPMDILKQMENYLRLFTNMILATAIRQDGKRRAKKPILFVLDEFMRLGRLEKILDIATVAAGAGIEALFVAQDKGQIDAIWGREGAGTLLGSCATVRAFGLGRTDSVTARWMEDQLGFETVLSYQKTKGKGKPSTSTSETKRKLLTSSEIQELNPDEALCFIRSHKPLRLQRIKYYQDKAYKDKVQKNPLIG